MPILKNRKHEAFAQELIRGLRTGRTQGGSYIAAGYQVELPVAEAAASRLLKNVKCGVTARVQELAGSGARRAEITAASVLEKLDRVYEGASEAKQYSAAGRAAEAQARIAGVGAADRVEIGGPGTLSPPTEEEMLATIAREFSPAFASTLMWSLEHPGDEDVPVSNVAEFTLSVMPMQEALERVDQLRGALLEAAATGAVLVQAIPQDDPVGGEVDRQALAMWTQPKKRPKVRR